VAKELFKTQRCYPTTPNLEKCAQLEASLDDLLKTIDSHWFLRAKVNEIKDGDKNTSHSIIKQSNKAKIILLGASMMIKVNRNLKILMY